MSSPFENLDHPDARPRRRDGGKTHGPRSSGWVMPLAVAGGVTCFLLVMACGGILALVPGRAPGTRLANAARATKAVPAKAAQALDEDDGDPYSPDCKIIRAWLKDNYGEVKVVSWGRRTITRSPELGDSGSLGVRFRPKGERQTKGGFFIIGPGDVVESATISD